MSAKKKSEAEEPSFTEALEELEAILERIETDETDIDSLAEELRRGTRLLEVCRAKIRQAELEVTQIVQTLEAPSQDEEDDDSP